MNTGILPISDRSTIAPPQSVENRLADAPRPEENSTISASRYSSADVEVNLSQRGRQLAIEAAQRDAVQATNDTRESQVEERLTERHFERNVRKEQFLSDESSESYNIARMKNDQTLDIGTQESIRLNIAYEPKPLLELGRYPEVETPRGFEVRDQTDARMEETAEIQHAINTATVVPPNSSQSASVASQYNISPESALGHSISTFA
ncbi:hypothetical protein CBF23_003815 [Marinomonas agarivorans]|nr:hypothetical protein CBF23_003815 [Marinomonas agarivorans]